MPELFHAIADAESACVRKFIVDHELTEKVRFRNVTYDEVAADLKAHGGSRTPSLWDGTKLVEGADAVLAALQALR